MFIAPAYAAEAATPGLAAQLMSFAPMVIIFALFWFMVMRPQQKKAKEHQAMLGALQKGDEVAIQGGILGRITKAGEEFLTLEIASNVQINVQRAAVAAKLPEGTIKSL